MRIELGTVAEADKQVLVHLMQLYLYDFSELRAAPFTPHGTFAYDHANAPAAAFWHPVVREVAVGPVEETEKYPPEAPVPCTWLRFEVSSPR